MDADDGQETDRVALQAGGRLVSTLEQELLPKLERINRVIVAAPALESMLTDVLDEMLDVFGCDRVWLLFPCDPTARDFAVPMERTRPEWPGASRSGQRIPMSSFPEQSMRAALQTSGACRSDGVHAPLPAGDGLVEQYAVKSLMYMAIRCRSGPPWCLGIHHCTAPRVYDDAAASLFEAIGARLADGLTGFLALQSSTADRRRLEQAQHTARLGSYEWKRGAAEQAHWSKELYRLLGVTPGTRPQLFSTVLECIHPEDRARVGAIVGPVMQAGGDYDVQARALRPDGEEWIMHAWGHAIVDASGEVHGMIGVAQDVTERVQAEEHQKRLEAQLRQSQKMEAIGQLTGGVAHDFNNLLTVILGNLDEIKETLGDRRDLGELLDEVQEAARRAADLTQRLTAFSRQQPLQPRAVDINRLVRGLELLLRRTLGASIAIEVMPGAGLWLSEIDPAQLENALLNLAVNARDAMPHGGKLTIETANVHVERNRADQHAELTLPEYVLLKVTDDGVGMSEDVLTRAFDPFFTTKGPSRGTGLGLSMVYGFVTQSGGHVTLDSAPGKGTTAKIYLPRSVGVEGPDRRIRGPEPDEQGRGELILVVEDEPHVRALTVRILERLGYRVLAAEDGASGLAALEGHSDIALLFTDVVLPGGMNGAQLARRAREQRPDLLVLYTSGYTEDAIIHHGRLDPGIELLQKPFKREALAQRLRELLDSVRGQ